MEDSDRLSALKNELIERLGQQRYELWLCLLYTSDAADE